MDSYYSKILDYLIKGGPGAIITILVVACIALGWVVRNQQRTIAMLYDRYNTVIDKKIESDTLLGQSLNQLRDNLWELAIRK